MKEVCKYIMSVFSNSISFFYLKYKGVDTKYGYVTLHGLPIINKHPNSKIIIHKGVSILSKTKYNVAGINHRTIIATVAEGSVIEIMSGCGISGATLVAAKKITIGKETGLGVNASIYDTDFHSIYASDRKQQTSLADSSIKSSPVEIGNSVWIAANCLILKGISIGDNAVIGAGSVVTKNIPASTIWAGNPAKKIRDIE